MYGSKLPATQATDVRRARRYFDGIRPENVFYMY